MVETRYYEFHPQDRDHSEGHHDFGTRHSGEYLCCPGPGQFQLVNDGAVFQVPRISTGQAEAAMAQGLGHHCRRRKVPPVQGLPQGITSEIFAKYNIN